MLRLIVVCGDVHYSHVAARAALHLLLRLCDVEKNRDAQYFLDALLSLDLSLLKRMQLHQHIISERGNRLSAFRLILAYRNAAIAHRSSVIGGGLGSVDGSLQQLVGDGWALKEFYRWSERRVEAVVASKQREGGEVESAVPDLSDVSYHAVLRQTQDEVLRCLRDGESGWREVRLCEGVQEVDGDVRLDYRKASGREGGIVARMQILLQHDAQQVSALIADWDRRKEWDVKYHSHQVMQRAAARRAGGGAAAAEELQPQQPPQQPEEEAAPEEDAAAAGEDGDALIVHYTYKSFASPYKHRDVLLLSAVRHHLEDSQQQQQPQAQASIASPSSESVASASPSEMFSPASASVPQLTSPSSLSLMDSGAPLPPSSSFSPAEAATAPASSSAAAHPSSPAVILHLMRSVLHPVLPETKQRPRAAFHSSAFVISPVPLSSSSTPQCLLTLLLSCDNEAVLILSADLLGETNELRQSFVNLQRLLSSGAGSGPAGGAQRLSSLLQSAIMNGKDSAVAAEATQLRHSSTQPQQGEQPAANAKQS